MPSTVRDLLCFYFSRQYWFTKKYLTKIPSNILTLHFLERKTFRMLIC